MVNIKLIGHDFEYEISEIINLFIDKNSNLEYKIVSSLEVNGDIKIKSKVFLDANLISKNEMQKESGNKSDLQLRKYSKCLLKLSLFRALKKVIDRDATWGILTGIRPTKIVHEMLNEGLKDGEILQNLKDEFEIAYEKRNLLISIAKKEYNILKQTPQNSISLYIGIPFCPTRCLYCSFTSNSIEKYGFLMEDYLNALIREIFAVSKIIKSNNWNVQTIYIGGGTPTSLESNQIDKLLKIIDKEIPFINISEITFEAGRPDSITKEKLEVIKSYGIDRVSINPQTMNQETLNIIKRMHTPQDTIDKFYLAREIGFDNINMDVILGLPYENESHIKNTMEEIKKLGPESVTVHTMAIKRASKLKECLDDYDLSKTDAIQKMIEISREYTKKMKLLAYYMYRQKNMLGNFENVGYAKVGFECIYNIQIMEEKQTIIALGAGATSKVIYDDNRIERIFNVKNVEEYIKRIDEMIERKKNLIK